MNPEWLLGVAPCFDQATMYSLDWFNWTMSQIEAYITLVRLIEQDAVQDKVLHQLEKTPKATWFVHYDHGNEYVLWGDDAQPIINLDNLGVLAGMRVYNMNCYSGKGLGAHARSVGIIEFLGYMDTYSFTLDALDENRDATGFGLIKALSEGKPLKDVVEDMRNNGYDIAERLQAQGKFPAAAALITNMNNLVCYADGAPPPPPPKCVVSNTIFHLSGWEGLRKFRALRQRIRPEKFIGAV